MDMQIGGFHRNRVLVTKVTDICVGGRKAYKFHFKLTSFADFKWGGDVYLEIGYSFVKMVNIRDMYSDS